MNLMYSIIIWDWRIWFFSFFKYSTITSNDKRNSMTEKNKEGKIKIKKLVDSFEKIIAGSNMKYIC